MNDDRKDLAIPLLVAGIVLLGSGLFILSRGNRGAALAPLILAVVGIGSAVLRLFAPKGFLPIPASRVLRPSLQTGGKVFMVLLAAGSAAYLAWVGSIQLDRGMTWNAGLTFAMALVGLTLVLRIIRQ